MTPPRGPRIWDRLLGILLLAFDFLIFGVFAYSMTTLTGAPAATIVRVFDELDAPHIAHIYGVAVAVLAGAVFAATVILTISLMRHNRISFPMPLFGLLALVIVIVLTGIGLSVVRHL